MISRKSRLKCQLLSASLMIFLSFVSVWAQDEDPNPDSPTPILISEPDSLRALANTPDKTGRVNLSRTIRGGSAFPLDSRAVLYVTNLDLMPGEDARAFRLYVEDARGRIYRFPVLDVQPLTGQEAVYAVTVQLRDELGFWEQPSGDGDVLVNLAWRGMTSNRLRLGLGLTGGAIKDDAGATPTPIAAARARNFNQVTEQERIGYRHAGDRIRLLEQATFGPTPALDDRIRRLGLRTWLTEQLDAPYPSAGSPYPNIPLKSTDSGNLANGCGSNTVGNPSYNPDYSICIRDHYNMYPLQNWFYKEALYGDSQLRHRTAWALGQMWVVSGVDTQQSSHMIEYHKVLSRNAFGNYRTLMQEMTLNPAMGNYLDMVRSTRNNPNENYAREILQLFSVGLFMLNQDGTVQRDASNETIPTYDQATVNSFTKVLTGWTFCEVTASCPNRTAGAPNYKDPLLLNQTNHDVTAKTLLDYPGAVNKNIAAGLNGTVEMNLALDNIYNHPNVAPFVSRFLIQHLVTSDPTPAYVGRISAVFNANRANPTQLKEVIKAILLDAEARGNVKTDANYGKLREPVLLATNLLRQFGVQSALGGAPSDGVVSGVINPMGQNTFYSPTVFNYYPPDYTVPGPGLNGPEFAILTTGTAIARSNFVNTMVFNRINVGAPNTPNGTSINLAEMQALAAADTTSNRLLDALNVRMMHGTMTAQNRTTILTAVNAVAATDPLTRAKTAIYLIATASQFQVQR